MLVQETLTISLHHQRSSNLNRSLSLINYAQQKAQKRRKVAHTKSRRRITLQQWYQSRVTTLQITHPIHVVFTECGNAIINNELLLETQLWPDQSSPMPRTTAALSTHTVLRREKRFDFLFEAVDIQKVSKTVNIMKRVMSYLQHSKLWRRLPIGTWRMKSGVLS